MPEKFYDFDDDRKENSIEPRYHPEDLTADDNNPIICDECDNGVLLVTYKQNSFICPACMHVFNPAFDTIKHKAIETTIEEMQDTHSGELSFLEAVKHIPFKTKARKTISEDEMPEYVKREIEAIQWRPGYKTVPMDKEKLSSTNS